MPFAAFKKFSLVRLISSSQKTGWSFFSDFALLDNLKTSITISNISLNTSVLGSFIRGYTACMTFTLFYLAFRGKFKPGPKLELAFKVAIDARVFLSISALKFLNMISCLLDPYFLVSTLLHSRRWLLLYLS